MKELIIAVIILLLIVLWRYRERFAAVVDPEQYVNSTLVAKY